MNLITFAEHITLRFTKSAGAGTVTFEAGKDYVVGDSQLDRLWTDTKIKTAVYKLSKMDMRLRNFHASVRNPGSNRVLVYNGSSGYGDQIMTWPVAHLLHKLGFTVHILSDPGNQVCWWGFPWVASIQMVPMQAEAFRMFDHYALFDHVVNRDEHADQPHPIDAMLHRVGIDPATVAAALKVVRPVFTVREQAARQRFSGRPYAIYQLAASSPLRSLPAGDSAFLLRKLAAAFPELQWIAAYDQFLTPDYAATLPSMPPNVVPWPGENLRELWAVTEGASLVVAPDSMLVHVAGTMDVPCVSLWGSTNPAARTSYYKNQRAIHPKEACPHSPCNAYTAEFPRYCPPRQPRTVCEVMAAISPEQVISAAGEMLNLAKQKGG